MHSHFWACWNPTGQPPPPRGHALRRNAAPKLKPTAWLKVTNRLKFEVLPPSPMEFRDGLMWNEVDPDCIMEKGDDGDHDDSPRL